MKGYKKFIGREREAKLKTSFLWLVVQETGGVGDSIVRVVITLRAGRFGVRIPAGSRDSLFFEMFRPVTAQSSSQWVPWFFPGVKAART
jgi:hypothetical protein